MIVFSDHAMQRIGARKISRLLVVETIKHPQNIISGNRGRKLRRRKFGDKILEVVTITERSTVTVITQYWLDER